MGGTLLKTTNGGNSWFVQNSNIGINLPRIYFTSENQGYAAGEFSWVAKTTDGGVNWVKQFMGTMNQLLDVCFIDSTTGFIVGKFGTILKTSNAGINWVSKVSGSIANLASVNFLNNDESGYAVGYAGTILKTMNGGTDWDIQISGVTNTLNSVYFVNRDTGFAVGESGTILKTTNRGNNWTVKPTPTTKNLQSINFTEESTGFIVGYEGRILKTTNGGESWVLKSSGTTVNLLSVYFADINIGSAVGSNGMILRTTNGGENWISQVSGVANGLRNVFLVNSDTGTVVGDQGIILKTTNGGNNWITQTSGTSIPLFSVCFIRETNGNVGYAVGGYLLGGFDIKGLVLKTTDAGENWVAQECESSRVLHSVYFQSESVGYAVGEGGAIIKTMNGGIPVELISFTANVDGNSVNLKWQTATELNNLGFEIERTPSKSQPMGENSKWKKIGFVNGNGTTTETRYYSLTDENVSSGTYQYRLKQIDFDGSFKYSNIVEVELSSPLEFSLEQNYPNPFNPSTNIQYEISSRQFVTLKVYDVLGNEITTLVNEEKSADIYEVKFYGTGLPSGIYFYTLSTGNFFSTKKMILLK